MNNIYTKISHTNATMNAIIPRQRHHFDVTERVIGSRFVLWNVCSTDQEVAPNLVVLLDRTPKILVSRNFLNPLLLASIVRVRVESHEE